MHLLRLTPFILALTAAFFSWAGSVQAATVVDQRALFLQAEEALLRDQRQVYLNLLPRLEGYPLKPYLVAKDLELNCDIRTTANVREFLRSYGDSPVADPLRREWLRELARQKRWSDFLQDYIPQTNENLQCLYGQALLGAGKTEAAMEHAVQMWLSGTSRPRSCDPLFAVWKEQGLLTRELVVERIQLAMNAGQNGLVQYLQRFLPQEDRSWVEYWLLVDERPGLVLQRDWNGQHSDFVLPVLAHGMRKLTRVNASRTAGDWDRIRVHNGLDRERFSRIEEDISLFMSLRFEEGAVERINNLPQGLRSDRLREWGVRAALRQQDWSAVLSMVDGLTDDQRQQPRWRYWRARAYEQTGWSEQAATLYRDLAGEAHYFGMLAADRMGLPYELTHQPVVVSAEKLEMVKQEPGLQRAVELFALKRYGPGRSEWQRALPRLDTDIQLAAALWAQELGWYDRAITATVAARHTTDLEIRFPLPHTPQIMTQSHSKNLNPAWVFGVMRQESLFMQDVGSSAGALGLMQIMPQTGQRIAGWHGERLSNSMLLLQPERNIRYGTTYLRRQLDDLQGHYALATAAYNAGQHRVKGWLPRGGELPADIWVETIPFNETRNYVERVLAYTAIYETRLGQSTMRLSQRLVPVQSPGAAAQVAEGLGYPTEVPN
ncbi:transglycosylase SLT domain-containing protein [Desulfonatronum thioautotrophicum]|uniref:transglycosylase SLT domain-containing protein n=1 Tax=Desulfonatronum thioautotrophicum TaxID=617001 RepID=UPI00069ACF73|nr:transglycosylase SLT domain-containing protein [Desulfonatronum thioautotrophicum]